MEINNNLQNKAYINHPKIDSYVAGFAISVLLTIAAYTLVAGHFLANGNLLVAILLLAIIQLWVQLKFFLHLGASSSQRWNLLAFISTVGMVFIIVVASLWIMNHLNNNMTPGQMNSYLMKSEGMQMGK